ncbi:protein kinase domain-containing protein [Carboxydothermus pertinax]|nr:protein kinase [Carboxydothermus pertinax]
MGITIKEVSKISGVYGQQGEEKVAEVLKEHLPDGYKIINSYRLNYQGDSWDIDHLVIGPNGIFVIETKNMRGRVFGGAMGNWWQEKWVGRQREKVKIGNPAAQVNHYAKIVKEFLRLYFPEEQPRILVYPIVVFAHEDADFTQLRFTRPGRIGKTKILSLYELPAFILSREEVSYDLEFIDKAINVLIPEDEREKTGMFKTGLYYQNLQEQFSRRYKLEDLIGEGKFSKVYWAYDNKLDREVAVKEIILTDLPRELKDKIYNEAQLLAKINHENIVKLYDTFYLDDKIYLIIELVQGKTLAEYVEEKGGMLSVKKAINIIIQIARAISYIHQHNIIHRDLKPENILISTEDTVKITDFGIAQLDEDEKEEGFILGTPVVMAPEQILGTGIDQRTDIFAIGCIFYYLLTGQYPFSGSNFSELSYNVLHFEPEPIKFFNNKGNLEIERIILKCLEKNPENRYKNVSELLQDLLKYQEQKGFKLVFNKKTILKIALISFIIIFLYLFTVGTSKQNENNIPVSINEILNKEQITITNDNFAQVFTNNYLAGARVKITGRILDVIGAQNSRTLCYFLLEPPPQKADNKLIIALSLDPFTIYNSSKYYQLEGFLAYSSLVENGAAKPVVIAEKIKIVEPWLLFDPPIKTVEVHQTIKRKDKEIIFEKIEFGKNETRLFFTLKNLSNYPVTFNLLEPRASQKDRFYIEALYQNRDYPKLKEQLAPKEIVSGIVVLEKMDYQIKEAVFFLGLTMAGEEPYIFHVRWGDENTGN